MDTPTLQRLADLNHIEWLREQCRWTGGTCREHEGVLRVASAATRMPIGPFNAMMPVWQEAGDPSDHLERARAWFAERERGFSVYLRPSDDAWTRECVARGYASSSVPGMVLDAPTKLPDCGASVRVEVVTSRDAFDEFVHVQADAYTSNGVHATVTAKAFGSHERVLEPHWHVVLVRLDDAPVAGAMALLSHGIAGIYWVATVPAARKRGLGELATAIVGNWALSRGAQRVVLQASAWGRPVYERMGYRRFCDYQYFVVASAAR